MGDSVNQVNSAVHWIAELCDTGQNKGSKLSAKALETLQKLN